VNHVRDGLQINAIHLAVVRQDYVQSASMSGCGKAFRVRRNTFPAPRGDHRKAISPLRIDVRYPKALAGEVRHADCEPVFGTRPVMVSPQAGAIDDSSHRTADEVEWASPFCH
jgi:hypothetical protein